VLLESEHAFLELYACCASEALVGSLARVGTFAFVATAEHAGEAS
jgi:hypothetical protein